MKRSAWSGALIAPLAAPIGYVFFIMVFVPDTSPWHERTWEAALTATLGLIPASYIVSLVFGSLLIQVLRRAGKLSFWWVSTLAAPVGAVALTVLMLIAIYFGAEVQWERIGCSEVMSFLGAGAASGFVTAAVFCVLAGITRYSRDTLM